MIKDKVIFIVGPTAVGKSEIALRLAEKNNGEIISCDSMQVYEEVAIANNKPSKEDLNRVNHHLVGGISVEEDFDVVRFNKSACDKISLILKNGRLPIVAGGSGLYIKVLLDGIFEGGERNEELRQTLREEAEVKGNEFIYSKLQELDPAAAGKIHPNDTKRVVRALEVCYQEEQPISELQKIRCGISQTYDIAMFGIDRDRKKLYEQIELRVDQMFEKGLTEEVKKLESLTLSRTAESIIGIREVRGFLNGEYDIEEAKEMMKQNTRRLAKRQMTWFRKEHRIHWIEITDHKRIDRVVEEIEQEIH